VTITQGDSNATPTEKNRTRAHVKLCT